MLVIFHELRNDAFMFKELYTAHMKYCQICDRYFKTELLNFGSLSNLTFVFVHVFLFFNSNPYFIA